MPCYAALDVSKQTTNVCVLDARGNIVGEGVVDSTPEAITAFLRGLKHRYALVGLEAATAPYWLLAGLIGAKFRVVGIEALHAHGFLKARKNKTDRNDARGLAEMLVAGIYKEVHNKSL